MTLSEAYAFIKNEKTNVSKPGLTRIHRVMELLDHPERRLHIIHVVGTNGKGSVTSMLTSVLNAGGYRVGSMLSPALDGLKDYYRVGGKKISDEAYIEATETLRVLCGGLSEEDYPSEFELSVALGILVFVNAGIEYAVLEAGMGGAKDATHLDAPGYLTVMTHIALDHTNWLGRSVEEIASEKAGILSEGETVVLGRNEKPVRRLIEQYAFDHNCPYLYADDPDIPLSQESLGCKLSLYGQYQKENAKTVCAAVYALRLKGLFIPDEAVRYGLTHTKLPYRFQILKTNPLFIMDGGHNPDCVRALTETLARAEGKRYTIVTGVMADKDYVAMYRMLLPFAERFLCVTPGNPRALPAKELAKFLTKLGAEATALKSIDDAAERALSYYRKGSNILCTGTLYMMADLMNALRENGLVTAENVH